MFPWRNKKTINNVRLKKASYLELCVLTDIDENQTNKMREINWINTVRWVKISPEDILKICLFFLRESGMAFHANCLLRRQYA